MGESEDMEASCSGVAGGVVNPGGLEIEGEEVTAARGTLSAHLSDLGLADTDNDDVEYYPPEHLCIHYSHPHRVRLTTLHTVNTDSSPMY